jgi:hypothetical protein
LDERLSGHVTRGDVVRTLEGQPNEPLTVLDATSASAAQVQVVSAATWLAKHYGLPWVGYHLTASAVLTFVGLLLVRETKDDDLADLTCVANAP